MSKAVGGSRRAAMHPRAQLKPTASPDVDAGDDLAELPIGKSNCYGNLEDQVCDLVRTVDILTKFVEETARSAPSATAFARGVDPENFAEMGVETRERLLFSAYQADKRARALRDFVTDPKSCVRW